MSILLTSLLAAASLTRVSIDSPAAGFLGSPEVARALVTATESDERSVLVSSMLVGRSVGTPREHIQLVCLQLEWHGGDVIGTFGKITGKITTHSFGRGTTFEVSDVALELTRDDSTKGLCK